MVVEGLVEARRVPLVNPLGGGELNAQAELRADVLSAARNRPKTGTHLELGAEFHFGTRWCRNGSGSLRSKSLT